MIFLLSIQFSSQLWADEGVSGVKADSPDEKSQVQVVEIESNKDGVPYSDFRRVLSGASIEQFWVGERVGFLIRLRTAGQGWSGGHFGMRLIELNFDENSKIINDKPKEYFIWFPSYTVSESREISHYVVKLIEKREILDIVYDKNLFTDKIKIESTFEINGELALPSEMFFLKNEQGESKKLILPKH